MSDIIITFNYSELHKLSAERIRATRVYIRDVAGNRIRTIIRNRVSKHGLGKSGQLKGYSTKPIRISRIPQAGRKPYVPPVGGKPGAKSVFYPGGYKAYRRSVGLRATRFILSNTGDFWRDFRYLRDGRPDGDVKIGVMDSLNADVIEYTEKGRPDIFELNEIEITRVGEEILDALEQTFLGSEKWRRIRGKGTRD